MPIREGHATVVYRKENGIDVLYSQSLVFPCYIPLFVKFTYIFPPIIVLDDEYEIGGTLEVTRFLFPSSAEHLVNTATDPHLTKVVAGYELPFTDKVLIVPTMLGTGLFVSQVRFLTTDNGLTKIKVTSRDVAFTPIYCRFHISTHLTSYVSKYYNQKSLLPLFTGHLRESSYLDDEPKLLRGGHH